MAWNFRDNRYKTSKAFKIIDLVFVYYFPSVKNVSKTLYSLIKSNQCDIRVWTIKPFSLLLHIVVIKHTAPARALTMHGSSCVSVTQLCTMISAFQLHGCWYQRKIQKRTEKRHNETIRGDESTKSIVYRYGIKIYAKDPLIDLTSRTPTNSKLSPRTPPLEPEFKLPMVNHQSQPFRAWWNSRSRCDYCQG